MSNEVTWPVELQNWGMGAEVRRQEYSSEKGCSALVAKYFIIACQVGELYRRYSRVEYAEMISTAMFWKEDNLL